MRDGESTALGLSLCTHNFHDAGDCPLEMLIAEATAVASLHVTPVAAQLSFQMRTTRHGRRRRARGRGGRPGPPPEMTPGRMISELPPP